MPQYGKVLENITYDDDGVHVTAHFTDRTSTTGNLVVGSDGPRSAVRTCMLGPEKAAARTVPISAINVAVRYGDAEKARFVRQLHPIMAMAIHPDGYWLWISSEYGHTPKRD